MFDRFSDNARRVMGLARQVSGKWRHDYIAPEHILLGLLEADKRGIVADVLHDLGTDAGQVRSDLERRMLRGDDKVPHTRGQLPFTQSAKRVLERTLDEAQDMGHDYLGSGHLLLALVRDEGIAGAALAACGVVPRKTRQLVWKLAGTSGARVVEGGVLVGGPGSDEAIENIVKPALRANGLRKIHALNPDAPFFEHGELDRLAKTSAVVVGVADPMTPALAYGLGVCRAAGAFLVVLTAEPEALPRPFRECMTVKLEKDLPGHTREELTKLLRVATTK